MSQELDEDLDRWEESSGPEKKVLENRALLRPISYLQFPKRPLQCGPADPVGKALETMAAKNIGAVLVVDEGRVVGIFSERDALRKGLWKGGTDRPIREFMTPDPDCLTPQDTIAMAMNRMGVGGYRHVPLVDSEKRPVGMLVMRDVVRYIVGFFPAVALNLPPHSEVSPPERDTHGG